MRVKAPIQYVCKACKEEKEPEDFFADKKSRSGRKLHMCKTCYSDTHRNKVATTQPPPSIFNDWIKGKKLVAQ